MPAGVLVAHPGFWTAAFVSVGLLIVGSALPSTHNWGKPADERWQDVTVSVRAQWECVSACLQGREWRLSALAVDMRPSPLVSFDALFQNALVVFTSPSREIAFTLEDRSSGGSIYTIHDSTGRGGLTGGERTARVVFREIPPGDYTVHARVLDPDGVALAAATATFSVPEVS